MGAPLDIGFEHGQASYCYGVKRHADSMKLSAMTTRLLSAQGKSVDAAPVSRRTAAGGKSPTRLKVSLSRTCPDLIFFNEVDKGLHFSVWEQNSLNCSPGNQARPLGRPYHPYPSGRTYQAH
jgi:hypothetical protein